MKITNILLAEDDTDDYNLFVEAFKKISPQCNISRARNGIECISYLKQNVLPEIIFLDLNIPLKNGLECLRFIKNKLELADIPVIIYSTSHYIKDIDAAFKNGAQHFIVKPEDMNVLVDILITLNERLTLNLEKPTKEKFVIRATTVA